MVIWRFRRFMPDNLHRLSREHIEQYLLAIPHSNRTKNAHLTCIKSFLRWCSEIYDIPNVAARIKMLPENPPRQRVISETEIQKVLEICTEKEADVIKFLANTGLRASEFTSLSWGNISPDRQMLTIIGKGRKQRCVPLNDTCRAILAKYPKTTHLNLTKSYSSRNQLYSLCKRLAGRAGIPVFGPHALRHHFVTQMLKTVPLHLVSKIIGHADSRTTEKIYWHLKAEQDLKGKTDVLDFLPSNTTPKPRSKNVLGSGI